MNPNLYLSASGNVGNNAWDNMGDVEFHSDHDSAEKLKKDKFSGIKKFLGNIFHFSVIKDVSRKIDSFQPVENEDNVANLKKVSDRLGSNEGGWYERPNGERLYVKFYENPSQGKVEFIANAIYAKLGIKAVRSEIINLDNREAIASPEIPGAIPTDRYSQNVSRDVQEGFVADAFLANWDVAGLVYDNIVQGKDGFYRVDNGGSLIFRARGGDKDFSPDSIPELTTMRQPGRQSGEVFANITDEEIKRQARELISKINAEDIKNIVEASGLEGEERDRVLTGLLGRLNYLTTTYGESKTDERRTRQDLKDAIRRVSEQEVEPVGERIICPKTEIVCDHDHIEGQKIDVINKKKQGTIELSFKLRTQTKTINDMIRLLENGEGEQFNITTPSGALLRREKITYEDSSLDNKFDLCDAVLFEKEGIKVFIADSTSRGETANTISFQSNSSHVVRTAIGLIKIEIAADADPQSVEQTLEDIFELDLGIPDAFEDVSEEAEREYKKARYKWQYAISGELTPEQAERAEMLERAEVFPGYSTFVEKGKHKEYLKKYGEDIRAAHELYYADAKMIIMILTQGLMSTTERFSRGFVRNGMSSKLDLDSGGGDNVFTRITNEKSRREGQFDSDMMVVFKPELFDRTDWFSYEEDNYGSTDEELFSKRLSPDALFAKILEYNFTDHKNEQMFRTGIGPNYIESIMIDPEKYDATISELKSLGFEEIDGKPIEEIVIPRKLSEEEKRAQFELEQQEKQSKIKALINGEESYASFEELVDLANAAEDGNINGSIMMMMDSLIARGKKEQLKKDTMDYFIENFTIDELKALASHEKISTFTDDDWQFFEYCKDVLGLDYVAMFQNLKEEATDGYF